MIMKEPFVPLKCCQLVKQSSNSPKLLDARENEQAEGLGEFPSTSQWAEEGLSNQMWMENK